MPVSGTFIPPKHHGPIGFLFADFQEGTLSSPWEPTQPSFVRGYFTNTDVSENNGTPKSSTLIGFSIINHPFWGSPIFGNTHLWGFKQAFSFFHGLLGVRSVGTWRSQNACDSVAGGHTCQAQEPATPKNNAVLRISGRSGDLPSPQKKQTSISGKQQQQQQQKKTNNNKQQEQEQQTRFFHL